MILHHEDLQEDITYIRVLCLVIEFLESQLEMKFTYLLLCIGWPPSRKLPHPLHNPQVEYRGAVEEGFEVLYRAPPTSLVGGVVGGW